MGISAHYSQFNRITNKLIADRKQFSQWSNEIKSGTFIPPQADQFAFAAVQLEKTKLVLERTVQAQKHEQKYNRFMKKHWFLGRVFQLGTCRWSLSKKLKIARVDTGYNMMNMGLKQATDALGQFANALKPGVAGNNQTT